VAHPELTVQLALLVLQDCLVVARVVVLALVAVRVVRLN
jgi:hypothetical protein